MDVIITRGVSIPRLGVGTFRIPKAQRPESQQSDLDTLNIRLDALVSG
jgi:hypothetical protein